MTQVGGSDTHGAVHPKHLRLHNGLVAKVTKAVGCNPTIVGLSPTETSNTS